MTPKLAPSKRSTKVQLVGLACLLMGLLSPTAYGLTANQVAFETRPNGMIRVYVYYTVPALKEFREAYVEFTSRRKAEKFYHDVLRGADFYLNDPDKVQFINEPLKAEPW